MPWAWFHAKGTIDDAVSWYKSRELLAVDLDKDDRRLIPLESDSVAAAGTNAADVMAITTFQENYQNKAPLLYVPPCVCHDYIRYIFGFG